MARFFKNKETVDLTTGDVKQVITGFALPIFVSQLFQQLYNTADSLIVGNFCGKSSLAAVSSSGQLIFLFISFVTGLSVGCGVVISKYFGLGDNEKVSKSIHTSILINIIFGILLSIIGLIFSPQILSLMNVDEVVLPLSTVYFRCYFVGVPAVVMYNIFKGIMNALGDSNRPLYYLIFSSILNVILDLIFVPKFGVAAAAIATTVSQAASCILCLIHLVKPGQVYSLSWKKLRFDRNLLVETVRQGFPAGIQNSVIGFANVLLQSNVNTFGEDAMAGFGVYSKLEGFVFMPVTSFSMAVTTFVSQNLGAGKKDRAKEGAKFSIITGMSISEAIGIICFVIAPLLVKMFNRDAGVVSLGTREIRIEALFYLFLAFSHCVAGVCRGAGKSSVPMFIMLGSWCIFRIFYITIAMRISHTIELLYIAYPLTWFISSVVFLIYFTRSNWVNALDKA